LLQAQREKGKKFVLLNAYTGCQKYMPASKFQKTDMDLSILSAKGYP
jgi:hypothetical protein